MSHNSSISGMGEPVQAIRVINEKRMLQIMVEINIILSCGKEYVKLAWESNCKPGQENLVFLQVRKSEMTGKTKKYCMYWSPLYLGKTLLKSKGRSIRFSDIQKYLTSSEMVLCPILWGINYHIFMPVRLDEISTTIVDTRLKFVYGYQKNFCTVYTYFFW